MQLLSKTVSLQTLGLMVQEQTETHFRVSMQILSNTIVVSVFLIASLWSDGSDRQLMVEAL